KIWIWGKCRFKPLTGRHPLPAGGAELGLPAGVLGSVAAQARLHGPVPGSGGLLARDAHALARLREPHAFWRVLVTVAAVGPAGALGIAAHALAVPVEPVALGAVGGEVVLGLEPQHHENLVQLLGRSGHRGEGEHGPALLGFGRQGHVAALDGLGQNADPAAAEPIADHWESSRWRHLCRSAESTSRTVWIVPNPATTRNSSFGVGVQWILGSEKASSGPYGRLAAPQ